MQIKRSPISPVPVQPHKAANLAQPLINISKASTPVRTRLVVPTSQPNSTPININKIVSNLTKSPNNKQNFMSNQYKTQMTHKIFSQVHDTDNRINLSPILALNRKINEGHQNYSKKSLTPEGHKVNEDYEGFSNFGFQQLQRNYSNIYMNDSKGKNFMSNTTNLRGSNCFKALIENRNRSPNKLEGSNGKQLNKKDGLSLLKESASSNNMFRNFGRQSKSKLMESRSFDNLKTFGMSRLESSQIKCMNNDGKKAKYRVKSSEEQTTFDQTQLYYCSKCTIPLVQQGFIVEQIGKETIKNEYQQPQARRYNDYSQKLQKKKRQVQTILSQLTAQQQGEIARIDEYYTKIFEYLQAQRTADKKIIENSYQQYKQKPITFLQKINSCSESLEEITNSTKRSAKLEQLEQLLQTEQSQLFNNHQCLFQYNIPQLVEKFTKNYERNLKLTWFSHPPQLQIQSNSQPKLSDTLSSRNHAMRFSFEKLIQDMNNNNKKVTRQEVSPLNEVDEDEQNEGVEPQKQLHTAFRDLFPEEEEGLQTQAPVHSPTFKNF